jgi:hypothetical protein
MAYLSALPTAFEQQVRKLGLDERTCVASRALRLWCEEHKDRCYIPEWLLARWGMTVDLNVKAEIPESMQRNTEHAREARFIGSRKAKRSVFWFTVGIIKQRS